MRMIKVELKLYSVTAVIRSLCGIVLEDHKNYETFPFSFYFFFLMTIFNINKINELTCFNEKIKY